MNKEYSNHAVPVVRPVPGTQAYWAAQREAFTLIERWQTAEPDDPWAELAALRRIAAHSFATDVMHAHGRDFARWIKELEAMEEDRYRKGPITDGWDNGPEMEPEGHGWCHAG